MGYAEDKKILIIGNNQTLRSGGKDVLDTNGYSLEFERECSKAIVRIKREWPDLILLDLDQMDNGRLDDCRELRSYYPGPVLVLLTDDGEIDLAAVLDSGADDYIIRPLDKRLFLARIKSLFRRLPLPVDSLADSESTSDLPVEVTRRIEIGDIIVDSGARTVNINGHGIELTTAEFDLLWLLARNVGQVVSRDFICRKLRGIEYNGLDRTIDLRITRLRKKMGDSGRNPRIIKSIRSVGYIMANGN